MWSRKPIKALIFDIGGVVVQGSLDAYSQIAGLVFGCPREVVREHAIPLIMQLERGQIDSYALWEDLGRTLEGLGLGKAQAPEKLEPLWTQIITESIRVDESMIRMCRQLSQVMPIAALSNTITDHADYLRSIGTYDCFKPCVLSCEVGYRKPELQIYEMTVGLLGLEPAQCLFIDDLKCNIQAAKKTGMKTHLFKNQGALESALKKLGVANFR